MHPLKHPRNAALVGIIFVVIAIDLLGRARRSADGRSTTPAMTMLLALGVAMALMAYVLVAGSHE